MSFEILYYFLFDSNRFIVEICRKDVPPSASKSQKYHWLYFNGQTLEKLDYLDSKNDNVMKLEIRKFRQGTLIFNNFIGYLILNDNEIGIFNLRKELNSNINSKNLGIISNFLLNH